MVTKVLKRVGLSLAAMLSIIALVILLAVWILDLDQHKPRIEAMASEVIGMDVRIGGSISIRFRPQLNITLEDLSIGEQDAPLMTARQVFIALETGEVLRGNPIPSAVLLNKVSVDLIRDENGVFNIPSSSESSAGELRADLPVISLSQLDARYRDTAAGFELHASTCAVDISDIRADGSQLADIAFQAMVNCLRVETPEIWMDDVEATLAGGNRRITIDPVSARLFEGQGHGRVVADFSGAIPVFDVDYRIQGFSLEAFLELLSPETRASGALDLHTQLRLTGDGVVAWHRSANGRVALTASGLTVDGVDLDRQLERYESTQSFNLVDAGAFFFAGPLGVAVTKGHDFGKVLMGSGGSTTIQHMASIWSVSNGIAEAEDVAMATSLHRLAMKGRLDFVNERFEQLTVALVDAQGCAKVVQTLRGPFANPTMDTPNVLRTLTAPVRQLFGRARDLLPRRADAAPAACEAFYSGSIAAPHL